MIDSDRIVTSETERSDIQEGDSHQVHSIPDFASPTAPITSDASKAPPSLAERNRQLTMRLRDAERALADEQKHHQQTQTRLWNREQEVGKLRREKVQATNELDRFIHHSQVFTHLTDEQIIQEATQLRCDVRDFTLQRVRSDKHLQISQDLCKFMSNYLKISQDDVRNYLQPPQLRPSVVQAFLWAFLHGEVFHRYAWLAPEAAKAMLDTRSFLYPLTTHASEAVSEGQRKFHMWRANTSTLLLNIVNLDIQRTHDMWRDFSEEKAGYICQYLGPLLLPKNDLEDQLADSIDKALCLDQGLTTQVASMIWTFGKSHCRFNGDVMEVQTGQKEPSENDHAFLVTAPGLSKHGRSSGDMFEKKVRLMKIEVACRQHGVDTSNSRSGKALLQRGRNFIGI